MTRKISAALAALVLAVTVMAPTGASAHDRRDGYYRDYRDYRDRDYRDGRDYRRYDYGRYDYRRRDRDNGDELAAGVVGLVLGLALGAAASQPREQRYSCSDNYRRCDGGDYYGDGYGYAPPPPPGYYDPRSSCTRQERQWDRYARRYVYVEVPC